MLEREWSYQVGHIVHHPSFLTRKSRFCRNISSPKMSKEKAIPDGKMMKAMMMFSYEMASNPAASSHWDSSNPESN